MIYNYIHDLFIEFFIDPSVLPVEFQPLIYLIELWGVFLFFKACLWPVVFLFNLLQTTTKNILDKGNEWRPEWTRKQKRSLRNKEED